MTLPWDIVLLLKAFAVCLGLMGALGTALTLLLLPFGRSKGGA